jgi:hypothetical protein
MGRKELDPASRQGILSSALIVCEFFAKNNVIIMDHPIHPIQPPATFFCSLK